MEKYFMNIAIKQAIVAFKKNEVPVGAVIVKNGKIVSKAYNQREKSKNVIKHAEIIAITKACVKLKNWRLDDCEIYVTMEPCLMCFGAILESRIKKIVYGCNRENGLFREIYEKTNIEIIADCMSVETKKILKDFFLSKRKK